ncbi:MAG: hypothetical protein LYZ70_04685 [Nitrososphaerales archaeon]|nr:hypothetical protein [Nitrososphaerales archaeon]
MNLRGVLEVAGTNMILILFLYWVIFDQAERIAYASRQGLAFQILHSVLIQTSALFSPSGPLRSPPALDWVQLIVIAIVGLDALVAYGALARRRRARTPAP